MNARWGFVDELTDEGCTLQSGTERFEALCENLNYPFGHRHNLAQHLAPGDIVQFRFVDERVSRFDSTQKPPARWRDVECALPDLANAAKANDLTGVEMWLGEGVWADAPDERGNTALMWAVHADNRALGRLVLEFGANRFALNVSGKCAGDFLTAKNEVAWNRLWTESANWRDGWRAAWLARHAPETEVAEFESVLRSSLVADEGK